ncbi:hypothetical protein [Aquimarina megaterium]|uniref:hypothetical protein n=1 Tax=Aquimarina megaterium TaxID=1443666 RepID=UPI000471881D|nr:hypothetical protein [Aquimarina megaterium]
MKKVTLNIMAVLLITLWACEQENSIEEQTVIDQDIQINAKGWGEICITHFQFNAKEVINSFTGEKSCEFDPDSTCVEWKCETNPGLAITPPLDILNPCKIIPCGWDYNDPWILVYKIDPRVLDSIKDAFKLDIKSNMEAMPFAMNESILGLQFYGENDLMSIKYSDPEPETNIFYLKNNLTLDTSYAKKLGLKGNLIKEGKYPVIFNKKNKTYNVILKVK